MLISLLILLQRETVWSCTLTSLIESKKHENLCNAIIALCSQLCSLNDCGVTICVDPVPGFCTLFKDPILLSHGTHLQIGRIKNPNKIPVAH